MLPLGLLLHWLLLLCCYVRSPAPIFCDVCGCFYCICLAYEPLHCALIFKQHVANAQRLLDTITQEVPVIGVGS